MKNIRKNTAQTNTKKTRKRVAVFSGASELHVGEVLWKALIIFQDIEKHRVRKEMVQRLIARLKAEKITKKSLKA